ncbi:type II toxin-antitoxin system prevent-host-death family antitoxin [Methylobacterium sp. NEAU 140]|uniref:type II toxin-antitoxin system Phd/YefM family antitoxin n=1 Tax=Methylobacterium sp. NEAU 140 TaxID=3064945 RepID=UPI002732998B|nr:type II toxin-antitoxin system prevent-host-death family antitoxin [Methylobacterium sp. NEAU 140]MDP4024082.1 type II toxin-antitoxin system prevent-host-death family antitoxin [Methylobacterium sp. NEAU 140]
MDPVSAMDARDRLDALLDQVERGHEVVITRSGKAVARLVPAADRDRSRAAVEALRALRAGLAARGVAFTAAELKDLRDEGRR